MNKAPTQKLKIIIINLILLLIFLLSSISIHTNRWEASVRNVSIRDKPNSRVQKSLRIPHSPNGEVNVAFIRQWGRTGSGDGQFDTPMDIAINDSGYVYVTDFGNHSVQVFTSSGWFIQKWGSQGSEDGEFNGPSGISINSSGYVYITDHNNHRVQVFTSNGTFVHKWGGSGAADGQFNQPSGIAINDSGYVYVTDQYNNRIQVFTCNGTFVQKWGTSGTGDGEFTWPSGIVVDSIGDVYVTEYGFRVQVFSSTGTFIRKWGNFGSGDGEFNIPKGVAVDSEGCVYVVDSSNERVQIFTNNGTFIRKWGTYGTGDGEFSTPEGIAVDSADYIYVIDRSNDRVQVFLNPYPQLSIGIQHLLANNQTINVTFIVEDEGGNEIDDVLLEISNTTYDWSGTTTQDGQYNLSLAYTPNQFTLEVNVSKLGYSADNETFIIYIDPPAVKYTEPVEELDTSALATFGLISLIFIGPWFALWLRHLQLQRKKRVI